MNSSQKYLPLGTIVRLQDSKDLFMIIGFAVINSKEQKLYDYDVCLYPYGINDTKTSILINHDQIKEIVNIGYETLESKSFKERLNIILQYKERELGR